MGDLKEGRAHSYKLQGLQVTGNQRLQYKGSQASQQIKMDVFSGIYQGKALTLIQNTPPGRK